MTGGDPTSFPAAPSPRVLLGRALDLDLRASRELRAASLFMALQFLFVVGPLALVLAVLFIQLPEYLEFFDPTLIDESAFEELAEPFVRFVAQLSLAAIVAALGWIAITVESQIVAITILAGRLVDRPVTLREAIVRSRQSFWRVVRAAFLVGIPAAIAGAVVGELFGASADPMSETLTAVSLAVGVVVAVPFAYVPAGIVLGDVGARESIARGFRLVRSRWSLAIVIALFTAAAQFLQLFAIGAGGDIVVRVGSGLDLGFDHGTLASVATSALIIASIVAVGTLLFTTIAISVAPQVVAFVALTRVTTGLDRARQGVTPPPEVAVVPATAEVVAPEPSIAAAPATAAGGAAATDGTTPAPTFWGQAPAPSRRHRMVSLPMITGAIVATLLALAALANIPSLA